MLDVAAVALDRADLADRIRREERYETIGRVGAGLMHDIGRRATSITRRARDLTAAEGIAQQNRVAAVRIEAMADEIADCVNRLARFPETGPESASKGWPLVELVDAAVCSTRHMHPDARIRVDADLGSTAVRGADDLRLALINVLDNAVRASPGAYEVSVSIRAGAEEICLEVRDRGCGMAPDEQARAFDAFYTTRPDGSGLGLASVRSTLRRLGGTVSLESEVGQGTRVRMVWPGEASVAVAS
jgi:signal transduction histidine kinase